MTRTQRSPRLSLGLAALAGLLALAGAASAEITRIEARADARVQELMNGEPASINADAQELPGDTEEFPVVASAFLDTTDIEGARTGTGQGFGIVEDPTRLDEPNPQELSVETGCYSNAADVSYLVEGSAAEIRTVVFSRSELDLGPLDDERDVTSRVFLSGAVIFWSQIPVEESDGLRADVSFRVMRDDAEELFVNEVSFRAVGGPVSTGPIVLEEIGLDELAALVDETTLAILHQLEEEGELSVYVIAQQEHEYEYTATVDEPIVLTATIETVVRNAPAGTGVAATLGRPFAELADFITEALPGADGASVERAINKAIADRDVGLVEPPAPPATPHACGALGFLAVLMFIPLRLRNRFR